MSFQIVKLLDPTAIVVNGMVPKGAFSAATTYNVGDFVTYNSQSYVLYATATAGTLPTDATKWMLVAAQGNTGSTGPMYAKKYVTLTDAATITVNASATDVGTVTLGGNRTLANPTGTPQDGQQLVIRVTQDATGGRLLAFDTAYHFSTDVPAPTLSTTAGKSDYLGFQYNATTAGWDCLAVTRGY